MPRCSSGAWSKRLARTWRALALAAAAIVIPARAHHSFAAEYDAAKPIALTGTVTKLDWVNPHAWLYLSVEAASGESKVWAVELGSPNALLRQGWTRNSLNAGDRVTVTDHLAKKERYWLMPTRSVRRTAIEFFHDRKHLACRVKLT